MLIAGDASTFRQYSEFIAANELELALDELEALASRTQCPPDFWRVLLSAANRMGLSKHSARIEIALARAEGLDV